MPPTQSLLPRFEKILYATDLSESGRFAFPVAASIAKCFKASLTVFHVLETEQFEKYVVGYISEEMWEQMKSRDLEEARNLLVNRKRKNAIIKEDVEKICQEAVNDGEDAPCIAYDVVVKTGDPADKIIAEAHDKNYDLVVMGTSGHRSIRDTLMGGTARRVLHSCRVPVTVVPLPEK